MRNAGSMAGARRAWRNTCGGQRMKLATRYRPEIPPEFIVAPKIALEANNSFACLNRETITERLPYG